MRIDKIPTGKNPPEDLNVIIEVPTGGEPVKYEFDKDSGALFVDRILPTIPAKRFGSPEEVSSAVVWLLCEGASYVTGTVLCVDGASSYTFLPLVEIEDKEHLPFYGTLPTKARL